MRMFGKIVLWFLLGLLATYIATVALGIAYMEIANVSQREGAAAMALGFIIAPVCAVIGGVVAAVVAATRPVKTKTDAN